MQLNLITVKNLQERVKFLENVIRKNSQFLQVEMDYYYENFKITKKEKFDSYVYELKSNLVKNESSIRHLKKSIKKLSFKPFKCAEDEKEKSQLQKKLSKLQVTQRIYSVLYAVYYNNDFEDVEQNASTPFPWKKAKKIAKYFGLMKFENIENLFNERKKEM